MYGRYGSDQLNFALIILVVVLSLLNNLLFVILGSHFLYTLLSLAYTAVVVFAFYRIFSRNIVMRQAENQKWLNFLARIKDRNHRYFRCPHCKQRVRVPRHKGKINIRCPRCGEKFIRKT
jgi:DNA-directed RNA polymerase subunit RPC12/RpoP